MSLEIIGAKTYLTCVSGKACRERAKLEHEFGNPKKRDPLPWEITYNERLENLEELSQDIADEYYEGNMLKQFLEEVLPRVTAHAHARGLDLEIDLDGDFRDLATRLKDEKLKARLCQWIERRAALRDGLQKLKNQKS